MDDSAIICDEIIDGNAKLSSKNAELSLKDADDDETKTIQRNFNGKKVTCILLALLLITKALLIAVSIYCHLINRAKQKYYHFMTQS